MEQISDHNFRVALYCRVSTEEQREGQTIESQIRELEKFAGEKGWSIAGVYKDEGWSGGILARPELDRLRDDASKNLFDSVLINDVDRLARDVTHLGIIKRDFERQGKKVIFRKLPEANDPTHNLLVNILGSFAEFERELISDRTRRGKRYKVEVRKQYLGAIAPYGFRLVSGQHSASGLAELQIIPEEAATVRQMYSWVDKESLSARKIAERLNRLVILPRKSKVWQLSSVLKILRSEVYAGTWHYNKHQRQEAKKHRIPRIYRRFLKSSSRLRAKADWLPVRLADDLRIVTPTQWQRVQRQLNRNIAFSPRNSKHSYLLTSLVKCGACGAGYVGDPSHGRFAYRCLRRCGKFPSIKEDSLNASVWNALAEALQNPDIILTGAKLLEQKLFAHEQRNENEEDYSRGLEQIRREETRILEAYRLAILTPAQLAQELETLKKRRQLLKDAMTKAAPPSPFPIALLRGPVHEASRVMAQRLANMEFPARQNLVRTLFTKIIFEGSRVRLLGNLPVSRKKTDDDSVSGRIATTASWCGEGNLFPECGIDFILERPVIKPPVPRDALGRILPYNPQ